MRKEKSRIKINKYTVYILEKYGLDFLANLFIRLRRLFGKKPNGE